MLHEDAGKMMELVCQAMRDATKEAAILLYSPGNDTLLEDLTRNPADHSASMRGQEPRRG
jgi:hypothetical protein